MSQSMLFMDAACIAQLLDDNKIDYVMRQFLVEIPQEHITFTVNEYLYIDVYGNHALQVVQHDPSGNFELVKKTKFTAPSELVDYIILIVHGAPRTHRHRYSQEKLHTMALEMSQRHGERLASWGVEIIYRDSQIVYVRLQARTERSTSAGVAHNIQTLLL